MRESTRLHLHRNHTHQTPNIVSKKCVQVHARATRHYSHAKPIPYRPLHHLPIAVHLDSMRHRKLLPCNSSMHELISSLAYLQHATLHLLSQSPQIGHLEKLPGYVYHDGTHPTLPLGYFLILVDACIGILALELWSIFHKEWPPPIHPSLQCLPSSAHPS